jgi:hypothetical protein
VCTLDRFPSVLALVLSSVPPDALLHRMRPWLPTAAGTKALEELAFFLPISGDGSTSFPIRSFTYWRLIHSPCLPLHTLARNALLVLLNRIWLGSRGGR